jgi:hypothetical protein
VRLLFGGSHGQSTRLRPGGFFSSAGPKKRSFFSLTI